MIQNTLTLAEFLHSTDACCRPDPDGDIEIEIQIYEYLRKTGMIFPTAEEDIEEIEFEMSHSDIKVPLCCEITSEILNKPLNEIIKF